MATCKDCVGNDFCNERQSVQRNLEKKCSRFKNKADYAEVKRGRWIDDGEYQVCSVCGEEHHWDEYRATYCEDCGAKMDGGADVCKT